MIRVFLALLILVAAILACRKASPCELDPAACVPTVTASATPTLTVTITLTPSPTVTATSTATLFCVSCADRLQPVAPTRKP
jgi:hypothetical protein